MRNLALLLVLAIPAAGWDRLIRVNGDALVESKPDFAVIRLNLEARDRLLRRARLTHEADIAAVLQVAAAHKIATADIAQDFPEIESRSDGFFLRRTIQVTMRDLKIYDAMLFALYEAAAVTVESVDFRVNDLRKLRDQARVLATRAAEEKAQLIATTMKRRLGRVADVRVEAGGGSLLRRRGQLGQDDSRAMQNSQIVAFSPGDAGGAAGAGAELFRVPVTAKVEAEYEILE